MFHRVVVPFHVAAQALQQVAPCRAAGQRHDAVAAPVGQKHRQAVTGRVALGCAAGGQRHVARQPGNAGQAIGMPQARAQCNRATLRKACQHDAAGRHAARHFAVDELADLLHRIAHAGFVFALDQVRAQDVVPGAHGLAAVDGDAPHRRAWHQVAHGADGSEVEFIGHGQEVGAVGTQAVQDDDAGAWRGGGVDLDGLQGHASASRPSEGNDAPRGPRTK